MPNDVDFRLAAGTAEDVELLRDLWLQMLSHHRALNAGELPVQTAEDSWQHARGDYREWLNRGTAILLLAHSVSRFQPLGYVVCRLVPGDATFDLGPTCGDVESLVVDDQARGNGVGTALLEAVRTELVARNIRHWSIGVFSQNAGAIRLYERVGFRPWTQQLLARTGHVD